MTRSRLLLALVFLISSLSNPFAQADDLAPCRVKALDWQQTSLGFPVRNERLYNLSNPKILVIPFRLSDTPNYSFSTIERQNYFFAASIIKKLSNGKSEPQFVFAPTINTETSKSDMKTLRDNQNIANQKQDETLSTWGFIRNFVSKYDDRLDFTGINGIILEGSNSDKGIAEAMTYMRNYASFFRPIKTSEGEILNAVLMESHYDSSVIAHEVMHLYGLPDLYGSETGPGRLSMMSSSASNLLSYEKWILGWLPDSDVKCFSGIHFNSGTKFAFDNLRENQLAVFQSGGNEFFVAEKTTLDGVGYLSFYSVQLDARPPMVFYQSRFTSQDGGRLISDHNLISTQFISPKLSMIVSDFNGSEITMHMFPSSLVSTDEYRDLASKSIALRAKLEDESRSRIRAEALKAEQQAAAEARAAAELKAKQDAEAKTSADKLAATKAAAQKKTTITCVKGKLTKKVTSVKPMCPSGFKRK